MAIGATIGGIIGGAIGIAVGIEMFNSVKASYAKEGIKVPDSWLLMYILNGFSLGTLIGGAIAGCVIGILLADAGFNFAVSYAINFFFPSKELKAIIKSVA